jgi:hypothetical protein
MRDFSKPPLEILGERVMMKGMFRLKEIQDRKVPKK